jgi:hypothetical protein
MVQAYTDAVAEIRQAYDLLETAQKRLQIAFESNSWGGFAVNPRNDSGIGTEQAERVVAGIRRGAVRCIMGKLHIRFTGGGAEKSARRDVLYSLDSEQEV